MDNNNDKTLSITEFSQGCKDFKVNLTIDDVKFLFNQFDFNKDGRLSYDEFLRGVRGEMNSERRALAVKAFNLLDKNQNGKIEVVDIVQTYNCRKHPAFIEGRKTEEQILAEFLQTFETHHNMREGVEADGSVTLEEFLEYYNNVSASIDDDVYFEAMMDGSWNLSGNAAQYAAQEQSWSNAPKTYQYANTDPYASSAPRVEKTLSQGLESSANPWDTTANYYDQSSPLKGKSISNPLHHREIRLQAQITGQESHGSEMNSRVISTYDKHLEENKFDLHRETGTAQMSQQKDIELKVTRFREALYARGIFSVISLFRQFKMTDANFSRTLDYSQFEQTILDCNFGAK